MNTNISNLSEKFNKTVTATLKNKPSLSAVVRKIQFLKSGFVSNNAGGRIHNRLLQNLETPLRHSVLLMKPFFVNLKGLLCFSTCFFHVCLKNTHLFETKKPCFRCANFPLLQHLSIFLITIFRNYLTKNINAKQNDRFV